MADGKRARESREKILPLPTSGEGYARVMLVGTTGAGKTTLLRHLIGIRHSERFPSISPNKTTTSEIEIVTGERTAPYKAVVSFRSEEEIRAVIEECIGAACIAAIEERDDEEVARALLESEDQRHRFFYVLGAWQDRKTKMEVAQDDPDIDFDAEEPEVSPLGDDEAVSGAEAQANHWRLIEFVDRVHEMAAEEFDEMALDRNRYGKPKKDGTRQDREDLENEFLGRLRHQNPAFDRLAEDMLSAMRQRFVRIADRGIGQFKILRSATGEAKIWPALWVYEDRQRNRFLKQMRWFTSNHYRQFGRLVTPLVNGIRVAGPFQPTGLADKPLKLVLLDGEGLGHEAEEAVSTNVSARITDRFRDVNLILLVDNAQSPMQNAPQQLLRVAGQRGHGHRLAIAFTHFDLVRGDNLGGYEQKKAHIRASLRNALGSMRDRLSPQRRELLGQRLESSCVFLGALDRSLNRLPANYRPLFHREMRTLFRLMQDSPGLAEDDKPLPPAAPSASRQPTPPGTDGYDYGQLHTLLGEATEDFMNLWALRLGLPYDQKPLLRLMMLDYQRGATGLAVDREHWARIKALCRRIAPEEGFETNEYHHLRPVADLSDVLMERIAWWLDEASGGHSDNALVQRLANTMDQMAEECLVNTRREAWQHAYDFRGPGSTRRRAGKMEEIYKASRAPDNSDYRLQGPRAPKAIQSPAFPQLVIMRVRAALGDV